MKKLVSIKGVIDNIRQSVNTPLPTGNCPPRLEQEIIENLSADQFTIACTFRHGFPFKPFCVDFDPIQRILAIGNRSGIVRIFGHPGIDIQILHPSSSSITDVVVVIQVIFIINKGQLITATTDDTIHLWDFKKKTPELVQSLKLTRERLTVIQLEYQDNWIYVGTERGNVHILNLETFALSGYQISWNKAIDPMMKTHPGPVSQISVCPIDKSKLLIGFETGLICLWDLGQKRGEQRYIMNQRQTSICWHMEGRQFVCSSQDGSLVVWNIRPPSKDKPASVIFPHATSKGHEYNSIDKVLWRVSRTSGEGYFVFVGGLPHDVTGATPTVSIMSDKKKNVSLKLIELEYCVLDFILMTDSLYASDYQEAEALFVMLTNGLVAINLREQHYPRFKNPYAMDFNESPVTCCRYFVDCPGDIIPCLYLAGTKSNTTGKSESGRILTTAEWPASGGVGVGTQSCSYTELVITGHADGSIRFWDASCNSMQALYEVKCCKLFEKVKLPFSSDWIDDDPYAILNLSMCLETRLLVVSGASSQVIVFKFKSKECLLETPFSMEIPIIYEVSSAKTGSGKDETSFTNPSQHFEFPPRFGGASLVSDQDDGFTFEKPTHTFFSPLRVRSMPSTKVVGYHASLICLTPWVNAEPPSPISCLGVNSSFGLISYGNSAGMVIVDIIQNVCLLNMGTVDLYGSQDPFQRLPKSPRVPVSSPRVDDCIVRVDLSNYSQISTPSPLLPPHTVSSSNSTESPVPPSLVAPRLQKGGNSTEGEGGISKSLSSSSTSLDQLISIEGVTSLDFVDSYPTKNDFSLNATLFVGTTLGSIIILTVHLPEHGDPRSYEPVVISPSGSLLRVSGVVITTCFMDCSNIHMCVRGNDIPENVHALSKPVTIDESCTQPSPTGDRQVLILCSDKMAASFSLPSHRQLYSQTINESSNVVAASIFNFGGLKFTPCLAAYTADGFIKAYSLPSLRPMLDVFFTPMNSPRVGVTMCMTDFGHGVFFDNPSEIQKFTLSSEFERRVSEMTGVAFCDGLNEPEAPKPSFFKGLFGSSAKLLDREELFSESVSGKCGSGLARHISGSNTVSLQQKGMLATSEISKAKMAMIERGEKLGELEDRTEQMSMEAKNYASNAHNLMLSQKNKKWYQI